MMRLVIVLLGLPGVAVAQTDARLAGCLSFAPRLEERLARCSALAGDAAIPAPRREQADRVAFDRKAMAIAARNEDRPRALSVVDEALKARPDDVELQVTRSLMLLGLGRPDEALAQVTRALAEIDSALAAAPGDMVLLRTRAHMPTAMDRPAEAGAVLGRTIVAADRALTLRPDNLMALDAKAFALERPERRVEANELLRRANAIDRRSHQAARAMVLEIAR